MLLAVVLTLCRGDTSLLLDGVSLIPLAFPDMSLEDFL